MKVNYPYTTNDNCTIRNIDDLIAYLDGKVEDNVLSLLNSEVSRMQDNT